MTIKFRILNNKSIMLLLISSLILILGIIGINEMLRKKMEKIIMTKLLEYQHKMEKRTKKTFYYNFSNSHIYCSGFFKYQCVIDNVSLFAHYGHINGNLFTWNLKLDNLTLQTIKNLKEKKVNNIGLQIQNFKPAKDYAALFLNNIAKYGFPINTQNYITFYKVNKKNNLYRLELSNSYFKIPALDVKYNAIILLQKTPKGFDLFLNRKNEFIKKPKNFKDYAGNIHIASQYKIIIKKSYYEIINYHIPEMLYAWYKNVGKTYSYLLLNNKFFYIHKKRALTFKEFNQATVNLLNIAIKDAKKAKEKGINVYIKYLIGIKKLYTHQIKALKVDIYNKHNIPLQALMVEKQLFPDIYHIVNFLIKNYDFKITYIK